MASSSLTKALLSSFKTDFVVELNTAVIHALAL